MIAVDIDDCTIDRDKSGNDEIQIYDKKKDTQSHSIELIVYLV